MRDRERDILWERETTTSLRQKNAWRSQGGTAAWGQGGNLYTRSLLVIAGQNEERRVGQDGDVFVFLCLGRLYH